MSSQEIVKQSADDLDLIHCAREGDLHKLEILIENGASTMTSDGFGNTLLHWAASSGNIELVKYLVWKGADVNSKNRDKRLPLYSAIQHGHLNIVEYFVREREVGYQNPDRYGFTPLQYTILTSGNLAVLEYLMDQLGDNDDHMNAKTKLASTPLHLAAMGEELGIAEFLIDKDVDCSLKDGRGMTPLNQSIVSTPSNFEVIKCLIEADPERVVDIPGSNGKSPLFEAIFLGDFSITEMLVKNNANVNAKDKGLTTPLQFAATAGYFEIVKLLVKFNADIRAVNKNGKTALQLAAEEGYREIVAYLESPPIPKIGIWFDTEEPVISFTGRRKELRNLHREVQRNAEGCAQGITTMSQMTSISGLGGIGKSEIIKKYARQYFLFYDNNVVWINAENYSTLSDSFYRLAEHKLNISRKNAEGKEKDLMSLVAEVYMFFVKQKEKSLFIFDNAEHYGREGEGIEDFLPARNLAPGLTRPYIAITSRNQIWKDMKVIPLGTFSKREAVEFLKQALYMKDIVQDPKVETLASTLQYYPLALQQAVAYIKAEHKTLQNVGKPFNIIDYLEIYDRQTKQLLSFEFPSPEDGNSHFTKTTFTTWRITFDKIKKDEAFGKQAALVLHIMSYFSPENIQVRLFSNLIPNPRDLGPATQLLEQYSLISLTKPGVFTMHRLVQQVTRLELNYKNPKQRTLKDRGLRRLARFVKRLEPANDNQELKTLKDALELIRANIDSDNIHEVMTLIPHAISVWNHASNICDLVKEFKNLPCLIITALDKSSRYEEAHSFGRDALVTLETNLGDSNISTLNTKHVLGQVLHHRGKYTEASTYFEGVLETRIRVFGPDHPSTLNVMFSIAVALVGQGEYKKSVDMYEVLLKKCAELNVDNLTTLYTQNNYAKVLSHIGDDVKALEIFKYVYEKIKMILREDHPDVLSIQNNIAHVLRRLGEHEESLLTNHEVFKKRVKILGADHPHTMIAESDLALSQIYLGKFREADSVLQGVLRKQKSVLGVEHPDYLITKSRIGLSLSDQCRYGEALITYQEVYETSMKVLGRSHPRTLDVKNNVASVLLSQRKYKRALELYEELLVDERATSGPDHPSTLMVHGNLAVGMGKLGNREEALRILKEVHQKQMSAGPENRFTLTTLYNIADIHFDQARYREALQTYTDVLERAIHLLGQNNPATLKAKQGVANSLEKLGRLDEARENFMDVFEKNVELLGLGHPDTVESKKAIDRLALVI